MTCTMCRKPEGRHAMSCNRRPTIVRFNDGELDVGPLAGTRRAERVAVAGLTPGRGRFVGGSAALIDVQTGETMLTVDLL